MCMEIKRIIRLLLICFSFSVTAHAGTADFQKSLEELGMTPLESEAIEFKLPAVDGNEKSFSSVNSIFREKWIFLTFWATWCGPCNQEIPELEKLYQAFRAKNFLVLGISGDQSVSDVERFIKEKNITFPILVDTNGEVSSLYRASAIPSIYLISPDWKIVGLVRGAAPWGEPAMAEKLAKLLKIKFDPASFTSATNRAANRTANRTKTAPDGSPLALPTDLEPPKIKLKLPGSPIRSGEKFLLKVEITWPGDSSKYVIRIPQIKLADAFKLQNVSSAVNSLMDSSQLVYDFDILAQKNGTFDIGPVELAYKNRQGGEDQFTRISAQPVSIMPSRWSNAPWILALVLLFLGLVAIVFISFAKSRKNRLNQQQETNKWTELEKQFHTIYELKHGNTKKFQLELLKFYAKLNLSNLNSNPFQWASFDIQNKIEAIEFGGQVLSEDELMKMINVIEKFFKNAKEST